MKIAKSKPKLEDELAQLRELEIHGATDKSLAQLENALSSKWEGVQVKAARILAQWGGHQSVEALKTWLVASFETKRSYGRQKVAVEALAGCYDKVDIPWILDFYFLNCNLEQQHLFLWPLIVSLPAEDVYNRLLNESRSEDRRCRLGAVMAVGDLRSAFEQRDNVLKQCINDQDKQVRSYAKTCLMGPQVPKKYEAWYDSKDYFKISTK